MSARLFDTPPKLGKRQQLIYDLVESRGKLSASEAGTWLHIDKACKFCNIEPGFPCEYARGEGHEVLESLRKRGLLKRDRHHVYRRTDQPTAQLNDLPPDF